MNQHDENITIIFNEQVSPIVYFFILCNKLIILYFTRLEVM